MKDLIERMVNGNKKEGLRIQEACSWLFYNKDVKIIYPSFRDLLLNAPKLGPL